MNQSKAEIIVARLLAIATGLLYGSVSVSVKLHGGRIVEVAYCTTEQTREQKKDILIDGAEAPQK